MHTDGDAVTLPVVQCQLQIARTCIIELVSWTAAATCCSCCTASTWWQRERWQQMIPHTHAANTHTQKQIQFLSATTAFLGNTMTTNQNVIPLFLSFAAMGQESDELGAGANCF